MKGAGDRGHLWTATHPKRKKGTKHACGRVGSEDKGACGGTGLSATPEGSG